jgi:hypothetical protein
MVHLIWRGSLTVAIALNGRQLPTDEEWDAYVDEFRAVCDEAGADLSRVVSIAISDGGAPTSRQRQRVTAMVGERRLRWVLLSTSRFARGVATALSWFQPDFKAYAPHEVHRAAAFLGIPGDEVPALLEAIREKDAAIGLSAVAELALGAIELNS